MALFQDSLDQLLQESMARERRRKFKSLPSVKNDRQVIVEKAFKDIYANPNNWNTSRVVAVIHEAEGGQRTLLGAFVEYTHKRTSARKLVRAAGPAPVSGEEIVHGDFWFGAKEPVQIDDSEPTIYAERTVRINVSFESIGVEGKAVECSAHLENGWIRRCLLNKQTQFVCVESKTIIWLPPNTDILPEMSHDNKVALRDLLRA